MFLSRLSKTNRKIIMETAALRHAYSVKPVFIQAIRSCSTLFQRNGIVETKRNSSK